MNWKLSLAPRQILNVAVALAGLGLLVVLAFSLNALFASRTQQTISQPQSPASAPNPINPMAGWKVYTDLHTGFSIKFPNNWYQEENPDFHQPKAVPDALETRVMFANFPPPFLGPAGFMPEGCRFDVLVATTDKEPRQLLKEDHYKQVGALSSPASESVVVVNGTEGIRRTYLPDGKAVRQTRTVLLLPGSNNLFALYFWKEKDEINTTCDDIFETMLKTFTILK